MTGSIWLLPCAEQALVLRELIRELARTQGTPVFEPHVTLLGGVAVGTAKAAASRLGRLADGLAPLTLPVAGPAGTADPFMACFVALDDGDGVLVRARERAAELFDASNDRPFVPHLSLLYGTCTAQQRRQRMAEYASRLPPRLHLDQLALVSASRSVPVEQWRLLHAVPLHNADPAS